MKKSSDLLILVDKRDNILGYEIKEKCHEGPGLLHRAFSIFIFNDKDELFIQKRSKAKLLWPRYWSNTCCSHPRIGESYIQGANRRLVEECGFGTELKYLSKFHYCANSDFMVLKMKLPPFFGVNILVIFKLIPLKREVLNGLIN